MPNVREINDDVLMQFHKSAAELLPALLNEQARMLRNEALPRAWLIAEILEVAANCMEADGYQHATTLALGLGYSDAALRKLLSEAVSVAQEHDRRVAAQGD